MKAVDRYSIDAMYDYSLWHIGDRTLSRPLVQDALVSAACFANHKKEFHHRALRMLRRDLSFLDRLEGKEPTDFGALPAQRGQVGNLQELLSMLSFNNRDVVILHLILGYRTEEMSEILNLTRTEVRERVIAAKQQMTWAHRRRACTAADTEAGASSSASNGVEETGFSGSRSQRLAGVGRKSFKATVRSHP